MGLTRRQDTRSARAGAGSRRWLDSCEQTETRGTTLELTETIHIGARTVDVFDAWAQLERAPEYAESVVERRRLGAGPVGVGARYRAIDRWPGGEVAFTVEIVAFERPTRMASTWSDPLGGGWDAIFMESGEGTDFTFAWTLQPSGWRGLVLPLLGPLVRRETRRFLAAFREWVESGRARRI